MTSLIVISTIVGFGISDPNPENIPLNIGMTLSNKTNVIAIAIPLTTAGYISADDTFF